MPDLVTQIYEAALAVVEANAEGRQKLPKALVEKAEEVVRLMKEHGHDAR